MVIYGSIKGFRKEEIDKYGFPIDGIQLYVNGDVISEELEVTTGTDLFIDICSAEWFLEGNVLNFKCICESILLDGNEVDDSISGDLLYSLTKASRIEELILSGDYVDYEDPMEKEKLKKLKVLGSLEFRVGFGVIHKKCNKVKFY